MKTRIILSIAVGLFSLMSGMAGQWTFNPQTGRLRHDESGWILMAEANGARNLTIVKTIAAPTGTVPLNDPIADGYAITTLSENAFDGCYTLKNFISSEHLTVTGLRGLYNCSNLTNLVLSKSVGLDFDLSLIRCQKVQSISVDKENPFLKSIDGVVFSADGSVLIRCPPTRTGTYKIPEGVRKIASSAFRDCRGLRAIVLPDSVGKIGDATFLGCSGLISINLPDEIPSIGIRAFNNCTSLEHVTLPNAIRTIYPELFSGCTKLRSVSLPSQLEYIGTDAFAKCSALEAIDLPDGLKIIASIAFRDCTALRRVRLPETLKQLNRGVFQNCPSLESIHLPKSLLRSGLNTISQFPGLKAFSVDSAHPDFKAIDGVLFSKDGRELIAFPRGRGGAYTIPPGVTTIAGGAFSGSKKLTTVTVPMGIERIGGSAFGGCSSLLSIDLPDSVHEIGRNAFMDCSALRSVRLPKGLEKLPTWLFLNCRNLRSIVIPDAVLIMDSGVFTGCERLVSVALPAGLIKMNKREFTGCHEITNITVSAQNHYYSDIDGVLFDKSGETLIHYPSGRTGSYAIPDGVYAIGAEAFYENKGLKNITIPGSVVNIGSWAFYGAKNLQRVETPDSVTNIGAKAFSCCENLAFIKLPANLIRIPDDLCRSCPNLTEVVFPTTLEEVGSDAFSYCPNLFPGKLPDTVRVIDSGAFHQTRVPSVYYLPKQLEIIGPYAFIGCQDLEHIIIPPTVTEIYKKAFANCPNLKSVIFNGAYPGTIREDILRGSNCATTFVTRAFAASWDTDVSFGPIGAEHAIWQGRPIVYVGATAQTNAPVPEAWQAANFTKMTATNHAPLGTPDEPDDYDPDGDPDGDGMTNAQEYVAGTDPNDADSVFRALITVENGQVKIHWEPDLGEARVYTIEGKVNLTDKEWVTPATEDCRFFRVRVDLPPE